MTAMEDKSIIELYFARDEAAIRETAEKYGVRLHALSRSVTGNDADAAECVNDAYLAVWESIPPHRPENYFFVYLARIVRHLSLNLVMRGRRKKRSAEVMSLCEELEVCIPGGDTPEGRLDREELAAVLSAFLRTLDGDARGIFLRRYFAMESVKTIALYLGKSEGAVSSQLYRSREALRRFLSERGVEM